MAPPPACRIPLHHAAPLLLHAAPRCPPLRHATCASARQSPRPPAWPPLWLQGVSTVIQKCTSYQPLGAPDLKCFSSITVRGAKLELDFDAMPFWEASKASCTYNGRYRRGALGGREVGAVAAAQALPRCGGVLMPVHGPAAYPQAPSPPHPLTPAPPADACNCRSQAVGGPRVLHRVSQPIFRDPCWRGGTPSDQLGVQTMCETFQWTGRRRMSGCSPEIIFP